MLKPWEKENASGQCQLSEVKSFTVGPHAQVWAAFVSGTVLWQNIFLKWVGNVRKLLIPLLGGMLTVMVIPLTCPGGEVIKMSTTTSTQASGLLDMLLPAFTEDTGIEVKVFAKGTGAAIRDGMEGNVDVIFVHAKALEEKFVFQGYGRYRYAVMHNDFVIVGPPSDPARIRGMKDPPGAFKKIAMAEARFISRGDDSGTHMKEQEIWVASGLPLITRTTLMVEGGKETELRFKHPEGLGRWYFSTGQGMGKTITYADEKRAYTLTDRGTYTKYKFGRKWGADLEILCEGDGMLYNPYGLIPLNPEKHSHVKFDLADRFAKWMVSQRGQAMIANYRLLGHQLFYPDAIPDAR